MRILLVIPTILSFRAFLSDLSSALVKRGYDVHCACSIENLWDARATPQMQDVTLHNIRFARDMNPITHLTSSLELGRLVSSVHPDIVHTHFSSAIFTTGLARRSGWPTTIGTFQGLRYPLSHGLLKKLLKVAEIWSSYRLDTVWVVNQDDYNELTGSKSYLRVQRQKSFGFGCDLNKFDIAKFSEKDRDDLRSKLNLKSVHHIFAFIGRFVDFKGFDLTIRAFLKLSPEYPQARLLLIGGKDKLHGTGLKVEEEALMRQSGQILDLGWQTEVQKYLAITDSVVFPSYREGIPVCLMEALAMGVPVITQDSRGCREVVRHEIDGLVLSECSVDNLAAAMRRFIDDKQLHHQYAQQALAGRLRFSRLDYIDEQCEIYSTLLV